MQDEKNDAYNTAIRCLARREYGARELALLLRKKGFSSVIVEALIADLQQQGMQSDDRFAESYIRSRTTRGFGPQRIEMELQQKGVSADVIGSGLAAIDDWELRALRVRQKKFGHEVPQDASEKSRQWRYLQYKGFSSEQINHALYADAPYESTL